MQCKAQSHDSIFGIAWNSVLALMLVLLVLIVVVLFIVFTAQPAQAQLSIIYNFSGGQDGFLPTAGLTMDQAGNLYGTTCGEACYTFGSRLSGYGTVSSIVSIAQNAGRTAARGAATSSTERPDTLHFPRQTPTAAPANTRNAVASPLDQLLYKNGPSTGICDVQGCTVNVWPIGYGWEVSDSFDLSSASTINGVNLAFWEAYPPYPVSNSPLYFVDWSIGTAAFGSDIAHGTVKASNFIPQYLFTNSAGSRVYMLSLTGLNVSLVAGNYWLTFTNSGQLSVYPLWWDENNGPSEAQFLDTGSIPSESFNISDGLNFTCFQPGGNLKVLHDFSGEGDGSGPVGVALDQAGNVYGATYEGGRSRDGSVYKLSFKNQGWILDPLYSFTGGGTGRNPATPIIGPGGLLYGLAAGGVDNNCYSGDCGLVYSLAPPPNACATTPCGWNESVSYLFPGPAQGGGGDFWGWASPTPLLSDSAGNLYHLYVLGSHNNGAVMQLSRSGGTWTEQAIWNFLGYSDGAQPQDLLQGNDGAFYGVASAGGQYGFGTVFRLVFSGGYWRAGAIYNFRGQSDGYAPYHLVQDSSGNLYGIAYSDQERTQTQSTVFMLSQQNGQWIFTTLKSTAGHGFENYANLAINAAGKLFVVGYGRDNNGAEINAILNYVLAGVQQNGAWSWTTPLYLPNQYFYTIGPLGVDAQGNLYGATFDCGAHGHGAVWQLLPN